MSPLIFTRPTWLPLARFARTHVLSCLIPTVQKATSSLMLGLCPLFSLLTFCLPHGGATVLCHATMHACLDWLLQAHLSHAQTLRHWGYSFTNRTHAHTCHDPHENTHMQIKHTIVAFVLRTHPFVSYQKYHTLPYISIPISTNFFYGFEKFS